MSAPEEAKPIGGTCNWKVKCSGCGWKGTIKELLGTDSEDNTRWCPRCRSVEWGFMCGEKS